METFTFNINGAEFIFYDMVRENEKGFVHEAYLTANGSYLGSLSRQYYNRTWERYEFEGVNAALVRNLLQKERMNAEMYFKDRTGMKKLNEKRKEQAHNEWLRCKDFNELYKEVKNYNC